MQATMLVGIVIWNMAAMEVLLAFFSECLFVV